MANWSRLASLLDKVQSNSTVVGKVWLSVLFIFRVFILAAGVDSIWGDEQANMDCNTKSPGCRNACYDKTFPMSHTRFWVLQILTVSTPTLIYLGHIVLVTSRENKKTEKLGKIKHPKYSDQLGNVQLKGSLLVSYVLQVLFKILLEVGFIVGQYYLYGFILMPSKITFGGYPCRFPMECFITRPTEKSVFIVFMLAMAGVSVLINIVELFHLITTKIKERKRKNSGSAASKQNRLNEAKEQITVC